MKVSVIAEYKCGHDRRVVREGEWEALHKALSSETADIEFNCKKCGRGASVVVLELNGKEIAREDASKFAGIRGATMSIAPDPENN